jgi:hypothetical protein
MADHFGCGPSGGDSARLRGRVGDGAMSERLAGDMRESPLAAEKQACSEPGAKLEITAEMIEAGGETLWRRLYHDPLLSPGLADDLAEDVLRAALLRTQNRS